MSREDAATAQLLAAQQTALRLLVERCPRLSSQCYWAGSAALAIEELHHRISFDLDFHTRAALANVRPILAEIQRAFPGAFEIVRAPDEFGSGFQGGLVLPGGERITIEVLSNYEDVKEGELVASKTAPGIQRVSLIRYLADKIQCVVERAEARDLVDILAVLRSRPDLEPQARKFVAAQDAVLLAERLLAWSDDQITRDVAAYDDVPVADACRARDMLLNWLKSSVSGEWAE